MDPYELLEPVEILSKMPKDFFEKIVSLSNVLYPKKTPFGNMTYIQTDDKLKEKP